jgi:hypothetical protein
MTDKTERLTFARIHECSECNDLTATTPQTTVAK